MDTIGGRIKALRMGKQLNQAELARRINIAQPSLYNIETGKTKSVNGYVLDALAKELNTTTSYLLDGAEGHQGHEAAMMLAELKAIFSKLPETDQESLLRSARGLLATTSQPSALNPFPGVPVLEN